MTPMMPPAGDHQDDPDLTDRLAQLEQRTAALESLLVESLSAPRGSAPQPHPQPPHDAGQDEPSPLAPDFDPPTTPASPGDPGSSVQAAITAQTQAKGSSEPTEVLPQPEQLLALVSPAAPDRPAAPGMRGPLGGQAALPEEVFWALLGLQDRLKNDPETESGAVLFTGTLWLPTGDYVESQRICGTRSEFDSEWSDRAAAFGALGHPVRLELLRHVLSGTRTTAALQEAAGITSSGQLHHHLRPLLTAGWLRQAQRGTYEVPAPKVVPLLVALAALAE